MSYVELLKSRKSNKSVENHSLSEDDSLDVRNVSLNEADKRAEDVLRSNGFKIRLVTPTAFGTQIDFAKQYEEKDLQTALKDYNIKIKGKSVFIVE